MIHSTPAPIDRLASVVPAANGGDVTGPGSLALHVAAVLARGWHRVLGFAAVTTAVGALAAVVLPKSYVAGTLLVPFSGSPRSSVASSALPAGLSGLIGGIAGGSPGERILGPVLTSSTLYESVMNRATAGSAAPPSVIDEVLRKGVRVVRNGDGSVLVQVRASDPNLAARIANVYPGAINDILARVSADGSRVKQSFLRTQVDSADARLSDSERKLIAFAQRRQAPAAEQQAQRTLDAAASLQQGIFDQEVVVAQLRRTATPNNPELRAAEALLASRREQLGRLNNGVPGGSVFVPIERGTEIRVAASRVERDYQQDQRVYSSLVAAVTDAQIDVSNALPVLTVLDPARPPAEPTLTVAAAAALSLMFGTVLGIVSVLAGHALARARTDPANARSWAALSRAANNGGPRGF